MPAGLRVAEKVFERVDPDLRWHAHADEGEWATAAWWPSWRAAPSSILAAERVALNFLGRLSGIATLTARYVEAVEGTGAPILDTRKTTPGLRALEKEAVRGRRRREPPRRALRRDPRQGEPRDAGRGSRGGRAPGAWRRRARDGVPVEVECATLDEVAGALDAGVPRLLLDNMSPDRAAPGGRSWPAGAPSWRRRAGSRSTRPRGGGDGRRLHQRGSADALGAGARLQPL